MDVSEKDQPFELPEMTEAAFSGCSVSAVMRGIETLETEGYLTAFNVGSLWWWRLQEIYGKNSIGYRKEVALKWCCNQLVCMLSEEIERNR